MTDSDANDDDDPRSSAAADAVDLMVRVDHGDWRGLVHDPEGLVGQAALAALATFEPEPA